MSPIGHRVGLKHLPTAVCSAQEILLVSCGRWKTFIGKFLSAFEMLDGFTLGSTCKFVTLSRRVQLNQTGCVR